MPSTTLEQSTSAYSFVLDYCWRGLPWLGKGFLAVLDQALISGSNFLMSILLARWLSPENYGAYALAFEIFVFLSGAYQALLLEPMSVFGPSAYADRQREYLGSLLRIHAGLAFPVFLALGAAACAADAVGSSSLPGTLAGLAIVSPCVLLFWLARRACYSKLSPEVALAGAVLYSVLLFGGLFLVYRRDVPSAFKAFLLMALAALVTSVFLLVRLEPVWRDPNGSAILTRVIRQHWVYGRWILASLAVGWIPWNIYYAVLGSVSGMASAGALKATLNLILPVANTFAALSLLFVPLSARLAKEISSESLEKLAWKMTALFAGGAFVYWVVVLAFKEPIVRFLYAGNYAGVEGLILPIAMASVLWSAAYGPAIALRAKQSSIRVFFTYCASSIITVAVGIPATLRWGLRGAVWSIFLSSLAALGVGAWLLRNTKSVLLAAP